MKDFTQEVWEQTRPKIEAINGINHCLEQLYADKNKVSTDTVAGHISYEELIGTLLVACDELNSLQEQLGSLEWSETLTEEYRYPAIQLPEGHTMVDQTLKVAEECQEYLDEVAKYEACVAAGDIAGALAALRLANFEMCNIEQGIETARRLDPFVVVLAAQQTVEVNDERGYYEQNQQEAGE